ncbi:hypothetical protein [Robertkochia solimangrovi]|uniref:hypothetical protein n=1 Tax=Robertkochia solimangrovi TaxID=2213046 RepID=UPI00117C081C|nr:hypothetical protein [Robertkochia solimangrovi]TRZ43762.1 hypothetical protein DMZ48_10175 [Robertkochia solimangrovi]
MNKKILLLLIAFSGIMTGFAQKKNIYESSSFDELSKDHKTVAILPFKSRLELDNSDHLSKEEIHEMEIIEAYEVQNALEHYFLKRDNRRSYRVNFQNVKNTNAILAKAGITPENLDIHTVHELCKILNVDALITGDISLNTLISQGVTDSFSFVDFFTGKSDYGRIAIKLSDGATGKLLWKYEKEINKKSGKNTNAIIESMMRQSTRKFPYSRNND